LAGFVRYEVTVTATAGVHRLGSVQLRRKLCMLTVLADPAWDGTALIADGLPALTVDGDPAVVPCSIMVTPGRHDLLFVRAGQRDYKHVACIDAAVTETVIKLALPPDKGRSVAWDTLMYWSHVGRWVKTDSGSTFVFHADGTVTKSAGDTGRGAYDDSGTWLRRPDCVIIRMRGTGVVELRFKNDALVGEGWVLKRAVKNP
jgi:hypothetical protein